MARIRTIKPEFTQSESIGRLSRDARLLFIQIWTIVDDSGRTRASSRGLASALYPFDDDARDLIDGWLSELIREKLITRYVVDGSTYLEVNNWRKHQKIDRPTPSRLPGFDEASRVLDEPSTSPRHVPDAYLGPSTLDHGPRTLERASRKKSRAPTAQRWPSDAIVPENWIEAGHAARARHSLPKINLAAEAEAFANYWASKSGASAAKLDWKKTWTNWCLNAKGKSHGTAKPSQLEQLAGIIADDGGFED